MPAKLVEACHSQKFYFSRILLSPLKPMYTVLFFCTLMFVYSIVNHWESFQLKCSLKSFFFVFSLLISLVSSHTFDCYCTVFSASLLKFSSYKWLWSRCKCVKYFHGFQCNKIHISLVCIQGWKPSFLLCIKFR